MYQKTITVAVPSKAQVCRRSISEIAGSIPAEGMSVLVLCLLCVVSTVFSVAS